MQAHLHVTLSDFHLQGSNACLTPFLQTKINLLFRLPSPEKGFFP